MKTTTIISSIVILVVFCFGWFSYGDTVLQKFGVEGVKVSALQTASSISSDDLIMIVDDPSGTPVSKRITFSNFSSAVSGSQTLAQVTALGSSATATLTLLGGFTSAAATVTSTLTVQGSTSLQGVTFTDATGTAVTTTALTSTSICLAGDICRTTWPTGGGGGNGVGWSYNGATDVLTATTPTTPVKINGTLGVQNVNVTGTLSASNTTVLTNVTFTLGTSTAVTTTNIAFTNSTGTSATSTFLSVMTSARLPTNTLLNGLGVCLADGTNCPGMAASTATLAIVTANGASTNDKVTLNGGFLSASSTVTSTLTVIGSTSLQNMSFVLATGTAVTTTGLYFTTASGTTLNTTNFTSGNVTITGGSISIGGSSVCLANGTNCPASGGGSGVGWSYNGATDVLTATTPTTPILIWGNLGVKTLNVTSTATSISASGTSALTNLTFVLGTSTAVTTTGLYFTTASGTTANANSATFAALTSNNVTIGGGTINNTRIGITTQSDAMFTLTTTTQATSTFFNVVTTARLPSDTLINATTVCLSDNTNCPAGFGIPTLAQVTAMGASATPTLTLLGGFIGASSTVTSTFTVLGGTSMQTATATAVTTTSIFSNRGSFDFITASSTGNGKLLTVSSTRISMVGRVDSPLMSRWFSIPFMRMGFIGASSSLAVGDGPTDIGFDGVNMWVPNNNAGTVSKVGVASTTLLTTVTVGTNPQQAAYDGEDMWVTNFGSANVSKIDLTTDTVEATVNVGTQPLGATFDGQYMWVANFGGNSVSIINPKTNTVIATKIVGTQPRYMAFDGQYMWVGNSGSDSVSIINSKTFLTVATSSVGDDPYGLVFDGRFMWVAHFGSANLVKLDIETRKVVATTTAFGTNLLGIAYDGFNIWVGDYSADKVWKIDANTNAVVTSTPVGTEPYGLVFDGNSIWAGNHGSDNILKFPAFGSNGNSNLKYHVHLTPDVNNVYNLGSDRFSWGNAFVSSTYSTYGQFTNSTSTNATTTGIVAFTGLAATAVSSDIVCFQAGGKITHQATNCTVSSIWFKENVASLDPEEMLQKVLNINAVRYSVKTPYRRGGHAGKESSLAGGEGGAEIGFIAEEVARVEPSLVVWEETDDQERINYIQANYPDVVVTLGDAIYLPKTVDYMRFTVLQTGAIQALAARSGIVAETPRTDWSVAAFIASFGALALAGVGVLKNKKKDDEPVVEPPAEEPVEKKP